VLLVLDHTTYRHRWWDGRDPSRGSFGEYRHESFYDSAMPVTIWSWGLNRMRRITYIFAIVFTAAALSASLGPRAQAQQAGGMVFELPEVRNYVAGAIGIVPDYFGSDDYTAGGAPTGLVRFGSSERYARLLVTEVSVNVLDSATWSFGPVLNYRLARDDVDDDSVKLMRDIDGTLEAGLFGGWTWVGDDDPRHRFTATAEFLYDVGDAQVHPVSFDSFHQTMPHRNLWLNCLRDDRPTGRVCVAQVEACPHSAKLSLEFVFDRQSICQF
jgi:hypothetical protein